VVLSMADTPEFLQLPLEYQGFCPWTVVHRSGLLLPGKPAAGVVRYAGRFFVFADQQGLQDFVDDPEAYVAGVADVAAKAPELIHILRLHDRFPDASIKHLIAVDARKREVEELAAARGGRGGIGAGSPAGLNDGPQPATRDAGTSTPTHFMERRIDVNYEWNEWALRRKALQLANIRACVTEGVQTDQSHFRRDNDSQVWLPKSEVTQTRKDSGTQPPLVTAYAAGLRGTPGGARSQPSKYAVIKTGKPGVLHLVLEPGAAEGHDVIGGRSRAF